MKSRAIVLIAAALTLAACSGNFSSGTGMPGGAVPPVGPTNPPPYGANGMPQEPPPSGVPSASPVPTFSPGTYAMAAAQTGFQCPPTTDGYSCTIRFNVPPATPTPAPARKGKSAKAAATATPSPTPSPTPDDTPVPSPDASASVSPDESASPEPSSSATPSKGAESSVATVALKAKAMPKDAPAMYHTPPNTLDVIPLMMVDITPNADFALNGAAQAQFTLPKEQLGGRGFAVQLFKAKTVKKHTDYTPIWTFDKSNLKDTTLTFDFTPPKMTIPKGTTYVLVLYGDDKSKVSPPPASGSPSPSAPATPSPAASATP